MAEGTERFIRGAEAYKSHWGIDYDPKIAPGDPATMKDLFDASMEASCGTSWCRPGLDRKTRCFILMSISATLGTEEEFKAHVRLGARAGITKEEMVEMLFHFLGYLGVPKSAVARRLVREVWSEETAKA